jgi:hypothetical protein
MKNNKMKEIHILVTGGWSCALNYFSHLDRLLKDKH